jgi:hypothetical protein
MTFGLFDGAIGTFFKALGLGPRPPRGVSSTREDRRRKKAQRQARKKARRR